MEETKDECKEVLENENSCKLTELFTRISETLHAKETKVLTDQTDSDAAVETHPAAQNKPPRKSRRHSTLAQDIQLLTESLKQDGGGSHHKQEDSDRHAEKLAPQEGRSVRVQDPPIPSQASQKLAESNKLEDQINLQHLIELMRIFHEADENGSDGLDIDEFRTAFGQILGKGKNDQQMAIMFMKIDTNCDGTVDWDEFCTYMLLEYQEKDAMTGEKLPPYPYPLKLLHSSHRETISRITFLPSVSRRSHECGGGGGGERVEGGEGKVVSVCKDGVLCFWKNNLTLQRVVNLDCCSSRLTWVTDMVMLPNVHKFLLSFTDNVVALYDLSTANCDRQIQIVGFPFCIVTMDYWFDPKDYNSAVLVMGDAGGGVYILEFLSASSFLFGVNIHTKQVSNLRISFTELVHHKMEGMRVTYMPKVHGDWVCCVKYSPSMRYAMSSSHDSSCSLHLVDSHGKKKGCMFRVRKGVTTFDYSKEWNIIATGGLDRSVRFWNPYVTGKPIAVLKGHSSAILHVVVNCQEGKVLSFSKDMELCVWDIQDQLCLQSCYRCQPLLPQPPSSFLLHPHNGTIFIGTNQLGVLEPCRNDEQHHPHGDVVSHERPLCAALYNENFNQVHNLVPKTSTGNEVVSGCHGSVVSVWDVDSGEKTIQFSQCHGPGNMEITAMAFDTTGRRLVTGGRDGSLKIWNFNNGACLRVLDTQYSVEVTGICFLKQKIVVSGWSRQLAMYRDTHEFDDVIPKYWGAGVHQDDVLCLSHQEPNLLASGGYDGEIAVWNMDKERPVCRLNATSLTGAGGRGWQRQTVPCTSDGHCEGEEDGDGEGGRSGEEKSDRERSESVREAGTRRRRGKDERAVEKIIFLKTRSQDLSSATLVACGVGGWVHFWNIYGGGLVGEFNVWDVNCPKLREEWRHLQSTTALRGDSEDGVLLTGTSTGYIQLWAISDYCVCVTQPKPLTTPPPLLVAWRAHLYSIVSIDLAEDKGLVVTASTDCCVRLWTMEGRYIGTFGEKLHWHLTYPICPSLLPHKTLPGMNRAASFHTMQIVGGPMISKWKLARNLFRVFRMCTNKRIDEAGDSTSHQAAGDNTHTDSHILGRCYERKTRFRQPIVPSKLKHTDGTGRLASIYSLLKCSDLNDSAIQCKLPSITPEKAASGAGCGGSKAPHRGGAEGGGGKGGRGEEGRDVHLPKLEHTEQSLLPMLHQNRRVTITTGTAGGRPVGRN